MNLRQAAQQALEFLSHDMVAEDWPHQKRKDAICDALRAALAEPGSDYERGFVDGMNLQTKGSVDKAVNRMAQTTHWEGCEAVHPECKAKAITAAEMSTWVKDTWEKCQAEAWQEPVAWQWLDTANYRKKLPADAIPEHWRPLYIAPTPQPEQKSWFTVEELNEFATKLKEKVWKA